jgi:exodeoxyribonuclease V
MHSNKGWPALATRAHPNSSKDGNVKEDTTRARTNQGIVWSPQQSAALDAVERWLERGDGAPFYLSGYAGTGKTTLAREIGRLAGNTVFAAYTGKASHVLRRKGCADASTIDSLIYTPEVETSCAAVPPCADARACHDGGERCPYVRERFIGRILNKQSEATDADLIVIDEVSMVGEQMGTDLLSLTRPVLTLGDDAQLPPVMGTGYFTNHGPDFLLTEVHRQALGSPVIALATAARECRDLPKGWHGDSRVMSRRDLSLDDMLAVDQVIVGRHVTRTGVNEQIRRKLGHGGTTPESGEKIICLKNNRAKGLFNGSTWTVVKTAPPRHGFVELEIEDDDGHRIGVDAPVDGFLLRDGSGAELPGEPFTYGYAITAHKAQGSQWDSVLVIDESQVFRADRYRWLYTAITRAAERVTVVQGGVR